MRVLITRPRDDAAALAARLRDRGHDALVEPLIEIAPVDGASVDLSGAQAILFTSANGVRAFAQASAVRGLKALAVGDATAAAARAEGFADVESAAGDVEALAALAVAQLKPDGGVLVHAAGSVVAGDLAERLSNAGFKVRRAVLYRAEPVAALSDAASAAFADRSIHAVLLFSPRTAETFIRLVRAAGADGKFGGVAAICLSPAVRDAVAGILWNRIEVAARPDEEALLEALDRATASKPAADRSMKEEPSAMTDQPPTARPAPAFAAPGLHMIVAGAAVTLSVAALVWLAVMRFAPPPPDRTAELVRQIELRVSTLDRQVAELGRRLDGAETARGAVDGRLAAVDSRLAALPTAELADIARRLAALDGRIKALDAEQTAMQIAGLTAENRRVTRELARLQEGIVALGAALGERTPSRRAELLLATGQLREALARGGSYATELKALHAIAGDDTAAAVALLDGRAERGIPPVPELAQRFTSVADAVVRASRQAQGGGWWQTSLNRLRDSMGLRRVGEVSGTTPMAIVARAEVRLAAGDLAAAVAEVEALDGPPAEPAQAWLAEARARLAAEQALAELSAAAFAAPGPAQ